MVHVDEVGAAGFSPAPDQPRLQAGRVSRYRHYHNLDRTEARLRQLLTDFRFDAIDTVVSKARQELTYDPAATPALPYAW